MKKLIFQELDKIEALLYVVAGLHEQYTNRENTFFLEVDKAFTGIISHFEQNQQMEKCSRLKSLKSDMNTCMRGFHPYLFEKITLHKRDIQFVIGLQVIKEIEAMLLEEHHARKSKLEEATPLVQNLLLAALQMCLLGNNDLEARLQQHDLENIWAALSKDNNLALLQKRIITLTSFYDAIILLDKTITHLRLPVAA